MTRITDLAGIEVPFTMLAVILAQVFMALPFFIQAAKAVADAIASIALCDLRCRTAHAQKDAALAKNSWIETFSKGGVPENVEEIHTTRDKEIVEVLIEKGIVDL